eukprot:jgi/Mesen1/9001/ME000056S08410
MAVGPALPSHWGARLEHQRSPPGEGAEQQQQSAPTRRARSKSPLLVTGGAAAGPTSGGGGDSSDVDPAAGRKRRPNRELEALLRRSLSPESSEGDDADADGSSSTDGSDNDEPGGLGARGAAGAGKHRDAQQQQKRKVENDKDSKRARRRRARSQEAGGRGGAEERQEKESGRGRGRGKGRGKYAAGRSAKSIAWLSTEEKEEGGRYLPQFGDVVMYFRQGHEQYLKELGMEEEAEQAPYSVFRTIQAVEMCKIVGLAYEIVPDLPNAPTGCRLRLRLVDPRSLNHEKECSLLLADLGLPDFIMERGRYEAAMARRWSVREECQVWWASETDGRPGKWWEGRIILIKDHSIRFPGSPWEKYLVTYKADGWEPSPHSPWEIFDMDRARWWPGVHLEESVAKRVLKAVRAIEDTSKRVFEDPYGLEWVRHCDVRPLYIARVPLPMSLSKIKARLEHSFYRSAEALSHDLDLVVDNARSFYGRDGPIAHKAQKLVERLHKAIKG